MNKITAVMRKSKKGICFILCLVLCFMVFDFNVSAGYVIQLGDPVEKEPGLVVTPEEFSNEISMLVSQGPYSIKLKSDITVEGSEDYTLLVEGNKTIDLNGFTFNCKKSLYVFEDATLTITDSKGGGRFEGTVRIMYGGTCKVDLPKEGPDGISYINKILNDGMLEFSPQTKCELEMVNTFDGGHTILDGDISIWYVRLMTKTAKLTIKGCRTIQWFAIHKDYFKNVTIHTHSGFSFMGITTLPPNKVFSLDSKEYKECFNEAWYGDYELEGSLTVAPEKIVIPTVVFNTTKDLRVGVPVTVTAIVSDMPKDAVCKWECPEAGFFIKDEIKNGLSYTFTATEERSYNPILFITSGGKTEQYFCKINVLGNEPPEVTLSVFPSEPVAGKPITVTAMVMPPLHLENAVWHCQEATYYGTDEKSSPLSYFFTPTHAMEYYVSFVYEFEGKEYEVHKSVNVSKPATLSVSKQPVSSSTEVGKPFGFSVAAENAVSYNWYICDEEGGQPYSLGTVKEHAEVIGENTDTLKITPKDTWLNGKYIGCNIMSEDAYVSSSCAAMTVARAGQGIEAPSITQQPRSADINSGDDVSFFVSATGDELHYQWWMVDAGMPQKTGTDSSVYTIKNADDSWNGFSFWCEVTNGNGTVTSDKAQLTVRREPFVLSFTDVQEGSWYYDSVVSANKMGLINGVTATTYEPESNITFSQAVKLAACMHQLYTEGEVTLKNGKENWYDTYYDYCEENEIIHSMYSYFYSSSAEEYINRMYFAYLFSRALPTEALPQRNSIPDNSLPDVKSDGSIMSEAIYTLYRAGIVTGSDSKGTFNPETCIKRSEVAAILIRMMELSERKEAPAQLNK